MSTIGVGVGVGVRVAVAVALGLGVAVDVAVGVEVAVGVALAVAVGVGVWVGTPGPREKSVGPQIWTRLFWRLVLPSSKRVPAWVTYTQPFWPTAARSPRKPPLANLERAGTWL
jgi:hypothetical protein